MKPKSYSKTMRKPSKKRYNRTHKKQKQKQSVFHKHNYESDNGFLVTVWGPLLWTFLHIISFNYPTKPTAKDKKQYKEFILQLPNVLPCKHCRVNLLKNFKAMPLSLSHMKNRDTFSRYIYSLHEHVNTMLKKKSGLSYCDVRTRYEHFRSRCNKTTSKSKSNSGPKSNKTYKKRNDKKESGCVDPMYGKKSKCVITIVPQNKKTKTFKVDSNCLAKNK
jgi:hypothetical protein